MPARARKAGRVVRVLISHDGLSEGEVVQLDPESEGWAQPRIEAGYLEVVGDADTGEGGPVPDGNS